MKKTILIITMLFAFFLAGCTRNIDDIFGATDEFVVVDQISKLFKNGKKEMLQNQINFENDLKCQERGDVLKPQYNNYHSIYYNTEANICYIRYYNKENIIEEAPIDKTYSTKSQQTKQTTQYNTQQTSQSQTSNTNSQANNALCNLRLEQYEKAMWEYRYCLKEKESGLNKYGICIQPIKPSCY